MMLHRHFTAEAGSEKPAGEKPFSKFRSTGDSKGIKAAVFIATRNWYKDLTTAVKSLFANSDVDKVFFVIEDDEFPYQIPKEVETVNASGQIYFPVSGPNYNSHFSYLCVNRAAYALIFEDYDRILSLDTDLVVVDDISGMWNVDLDGNYCAGVIDKGIGRPGYYNAGVILMDLEAIRNDGIADNMVELLNRSYRPYIDQDALNECCNGRILELPTRYNESQVTGRTGNPAIVHYVGVSKTGGANKEYRHYWNEYEAMTWEEVAALRKERYGKDLAI